MHRLCQGLWIPWVYIMLNILEETYYFLNILEETYCKCITEIILVNKLSMFHGNIACNAIYMRCCFNMETCNNVQLHVTSMRSIQWWQQINPCLMKIPLGITICSKLILNGQCFDWTVFELHSLKSTNTWDVYFEVRIFL